MLHVQVGLFFLSTIGPEPVEEYNLDGQVVTMATELEFWSVSAHTLQLPHLCTLKQNM